MTHLNWRHLEKFSESNMENSGFNLCEGLIHAHIPMKQVKLMIAKIQIWQPCFFKYFFFKLWLIFIGKFGLSHESWGITTITLVPCSILWSCFIVNAFKVVETSVKPPPFLGWHEHPLAESNNTLLPLLKNYLCRTINKFDCDEFETSESDWTILWHPQAKK